MEAEKKVVRLYLGRHPNAFDGLDSQSQRSHEHAMFTITFLDDHKLGAYQHMLARMICPKLMVFTADQ